MFVAICALISIAMILSVKHFVVTRVLVGDSSFKVDASVEDGFKRMNPNSLFLIASTIWLIYGIYLYVWRTPIFERLQSLIKVIDMPEPLRELALSISLLGWGLIGVGLTLSYLLWSFLTNKNGRKITVGTKGVAIGDMIFRWNEMQAIQLTTQRLGFVSDKKIHHYSFNLSPAQYDQMLQYCEPIN